MDNNKGTRDKHKGDDKMNANGLADYDDLSPVWGLIGAAIIVIAPAYFWILAFVL